MGRPPEMSESEGGRREKRGRRGQYKRTTFTQRGKQKQMQHANIQFHTILVRTPLSRARGIQRRYSPQEGAVHTQVSHNRLTQHSTDSNTRPLSASHWSGVSRDTVFTNTPTTQVCRLLLLTTGLRWCRITGRLLYLHLLRGGTVEDVSPLVGAKTTSSHRLPVVALLGCSGSGRGRGGEGGSVTGKSLQVRQLLDLINFGVCVLNCFKKKNEVELRHLSVLVECLEECWHDNSVVNRNDSSFLSLSSHPLFATAYNDVILRSTLYSITICTTIVYNAF